MNETAMPEASAEAPEVAAPMPGAILLEERRRQSLSLTDVARQLKLSPRQVEALERDDYAALPGPVFVRGFMRNYARHAGRRCGAPGAFGRSHGFRPARRMPRWSRVRCPDPARRRLRWPRRCRGPAAATACRCTW